MKLYELNRGTEFVLCETPKQPPDIQTDPDFHKVYRLNNIDGMYSHVTGRDGRTYHFAAWTEVNEVKYNRLHRIEWWRWRTLYRSSYPNLNKHI